MIVLRCCHSSTTPEHTRELQDILITLAAFGLPLKVVFAGAGMRLLDRREGRDTELLAMLPGMGVEKVLLEVAEGERPPLACDHAVLPFDFVSPDDVHTLLSSARHAVNL